MKHTSLVILFAFALISNLRAQSTGSQFSLSRKQIIDSLVTHPNLKFQIKFKYFKKLKIDDLYRFYSESQSEITMYENNRAITNFGTILMSIAAADLIAIPFGAKALHNTDGTVFFAMVGSFIPIALVGVIVHYVGPHKKDLYQTLIQKNKAY